MTRRRRRVPPAVTVLALPATLAAAGWLIAVVARLMGIR